MKCPDHGDTMVSRRTKYGFRWDCAVDGCTVACWSGSTSTPADDETRALRHRCHELFDPLWKKKTRFKKRDNAYHWLAAFMGTEPGQNHIGMFTREQCRKLIDHLLANEPAAKAE